MGEPNVKESAGGLRDIHTAMWLASTKFGTRTLRELADKRLINAREQKTTDEALTFLWRVRNELHFLSGHKNDVLSRDIQPQIAKNFGYAGDELSLRRREVHARLLPARAGDPPGVAAADRPLPRDALAAAPACSAARARRRSPTASSCSTSSSTWPVRRARLPRGAAAAPQGLLAQPPARLRARGGRGARHRGLARPDRRRLPASRRRRAISSSASAGAGAGSPRPCARCTSWACSAATCPSGAR